MIPNDQIEKIHRYDVFCYTILVKKLIIISLILLLFITIIVPAFIFFIDNIDVPLQEIKSVDFSLSWFTFSYEILIETVIILIFGIYTIYRAFTWRNKYKDFEKYLLNKRLRMGDNEYQYFLEMEIASLSQQIFRRKYIGQESDQELQKSLDLASVKLKNILTRNENDKSNTKRNRHLLIFWRIRNLIDL